MKCSFRVWRLELRPSVFKPSSGKVIPIKVWFISLYWIELITTCSHNLQTYWHSLNRRQVFHLVSVTSRKKSLESILDIRSFSSSGFMFSSLCSPLLIPSPAAATVFADGRGGGGVVQDEPGLYNEAGLWTKMLTFLFEIGETWDSRNCVRHLNSKPLF